MSPRIKVLRKISNPPIIKGFKPYGPDLKEENSSKVNLLFEEYEALRLSDYDSLDHFQASVIMGVSRPTFTRIYASALQKIAVAFVEGRQMVIEGGAVYFDNDWYKCHKCGCFFNNPNKELKVENCPLCGGNQICGYEQEKMDKFDTRGRCDDNCVCPACGYIKEHQRGLPCNKHLCPECGIPMKRSTRKNC